MIRAVGKVAQSIKLISSNHYSYRGTAFAAEEEADPIRRYGGRTIPPASLDPAGEVAVHG